MRGTFDINKSDFLPCCVNVVNELVENVKKKQKILNVKSIKLQAEAKELIKR